MINNRLKLSKKLNVPEYVIDDCILSLNNLISIWINNSSSIKWEYAYKPDCLSKSQAKEIVKYWEEYVYPKHRKSDNEN
jgi:hypothetical protein